MGVSPSHGGRGGRGVSAGVRTSAASSCSNRRRSSSRQSTWRASWGNPPAHPSILIRRWVTLNERKWVTFDQRRSVAVLLADQLQTGSGEPMVVGRHRTLDDPRRSELLANRGLDHDGDGQHEVAAFKF